jgi:branched-chain amino acid aminotransferase
MASLAVQAYDDRDGWIWLDGEFVEWRSAKVSIISEGLTHGLSVFEGERIYDGEIFLSQLHSQRLKRSAQLLGFDVPYSISDLEAMKKDLIEKNGHGGKDYVRLLAWVESPYKPSRRPTDGVRIAAAVWSWGNYYQSKHEGVKLTLASWRRPDPRTAPCDAKASGLYMICTMAKEAAESAGFDDGLMLDWRGFVAEATSSNIFLIRENELHTPIADCFLNGLTRQTVLRLAERRGITVHQRRIKPDEIESFEDCFLTGSAAEISPVARIDSKYFSPSGLTGQLIDDYRDAVHGRLSVW